MTSQKAPTRSVAPASARIAFDRVLYCPIIGNSQAQGSDPMLAGDEDLKVEPTEHTRSKNKSASLSKLLRK